jgi:hypothetical protein
MNVRPHSTVVQAIVNPPIGPTGDITIVDVGVSGGLADYWNAFGGSLRAIGFDPLVNAVKKLAASEQRPGVQYEAAYVGCRDFDTLFPADQRQVRVDPYLRVSAVRAQALVRMDFVADKQNEGEPLVWSDRHLTLDEYFPPSTELDFLKVDTDGSDLQVLVGADRLLREGAFLGVLIEAQFQGWPHDYANTFANIDRWLRARGFALYDIDHHRYTRAALPGMFARDLLAETQSGQLLWGDALYFRDLAHPAYAATWHYAITRRRLLTLAAFFDLFALPDCAAELLLSQPALTSDAERSTLLDQLVASAGFQARYADHLRRFKSEPESFFPPPVPATPAMSTPAPRRWRSRLARVRRRLGM